MQAGSHYKYVVVTAQSSKNLEQQVVKQMDNGFRPAGGVAEINGQIAQAMYYIPEKYK